MRMTVSPRDNSLVVLEVKSILGPGGHNNLTWHDQFAYFVSAGWGATVKLLP